MALLVKQGSFLAQTEQDVTQTIEVGFQPKALIFHSVHLVGNDAYIQSNQFNDDASIMHGFATSPTEQGVNQSYILYTGAAQNFHLNTHCIRLGHSSINITAYLSDISSTGFTLTYDSPSIGDYQGEVFYTALGGDEVQGAKVIETQRTSTGSHVVTGVGFQPNVLIQSTSTNRGNQGFMYNFGVATSSGQWSHSAGSASTTSTGATSQLLTNRFISMQQSHNGIYGVATLSSFNPDGFTLNFTNAMLADAYSTILALKLATPPVTGSITQKTTTGTTSYSGFSAAPKFMLFANRSQTASTGYTTNATVNTGWTDGTEQLSTGASRDSSKWAWSRQQFTNTIATYTSPTTQQAKPQSYGEATVSFDPNGFTTNWTQVDGTARQVVYLAFLSAAATGEIEDGEVSLTAETSFSLDTHRMRSTEVSTSAETSTMFETNKVMASTVSGVGSSDMTAAFNTDALGTFNLAGDLSTLIEFGRVTQSEVSLASDTELFALGGKRFDIAASMQATSNFSPTYTRTRRMTFGAPFSGELLFAPRFGGFHYRVVRNGFVNLSGDSELLAEFDSFGAGVSIRLSGNLKATILTSMVADVGISMESIVTTSTDGQIVKQTDFGLDSSVDVWIVPTYIRTSGVSLQSSLDIEAQPSAWRQGTYHLSSNLGISTQSSADYATSAEYSSSSYQDVTLNRVRELESAFATTSGFAFDLQRLKGMGLDLTSQSEIEAWISRITGSMTELTSISAIEVVPHADYRGSLFAESRSDLNFKASPILLVTYEDALGQTRQSFVAQTEHGDKLGRHTPAIKGVAQNQKYIGIERK